MHLHFTQISLLLLATINVKVFPSFLVPRQEGLSLPLSVSVTLLQVASAAVDGGDWPAFVSSSFLPSSSSSLPSPARRGPLERNETRPEFFPREGKRARPRSIARGRVGFATRTRRFSAKNSKFSYTQRLNPKRPQFWFLLMGHRLRVPAPHRITQPMSQLFFTICVHTER